MKPSTQELTESHVRSLADAAHVDVRTILRALAGLPVRGRAGVRALQALKKHEHAQDAGDR